MAKQKIERIYNPMWKIQIMKYLKKEYGKTTMEDVPPFGEKEVTRIDGWREEIIERELDKEDFVIKPKSHKIKDGIMTPGAYELVFYNLRDDGHPPEFLVKNIEVAYIKNALLHQLVVKLPEDGAVMVRSNRGKDYFVECNFKPDIDELLTATNEDKVWALINTRLDPWVCVDIIIEREEKEDVVVTGETVFF